MDEKWKEAKRKYEEIEIPSDYRDQIAKTLSSRGNRKRVVWPKWILIGACSFLFLFVFLPNQYPVIAESLKDIPLIGPFSRLFLTKQYHEANDQQIIDVRMPELKNTGNTALEKAINQEIHKRMDEIVSKAKESARLYKKAILDTGGKESDYSPMLLSIDYQVRYQQGDYLSFEIIRQQLSASSYQENIYYNLNLKTGARLTLKDLLGDHYQEKIKKQVLSQIEKRKQNDTNAIFFDEDPQFLTIKENQEFYINPQGKIVVVFPKYEIAPGYMGILEFPLSLDTFLEPMS